MDSCGCAAAHPTIIYGLSASSYTSQQATAQGVNSAGNVVGGVSYVGGGGTVTQAFTYVGGAYNVNGTIDADIRNTLGSGTSTATNGGTYANAVNNAATPQVVGWYYPSELEHHA